MINHVKSNITHLVTHRMENPNQNEEIVFCKDVISLENEAEAQVLKKYFLSHFKDPEYFRFTFQDDEIHLNPLFNYVGNIFDNKEFFYEQSIKIVKHLFECSKNPNIKAGDFFLVYFEDLFIDEEMVDAIGIFKAENKDMFIKNVAEQNDIKIFFEEGINVDKADKSTIIFNMQQETGFKILNIDHSNRNKDAAYWRDEFLKITPLANDYLHTKTYINLTKQFVKKQQKNDGDVDKIADSEILSRSWEYFKKNEVFDDKEYEIEVLKDEKVIDSFQEFKNDYKFLNETDLENSFNISEYAVNKNARVFKSVIKLDKNFHVYIHGDKNKISKGIEDDGQKYYKLYYNEEN